MKNYIVHVPNIDYKVICGKEDYEKVLLIYHFYYQFVNVKESPIVEMATVFFDDILGKGEFKRLMIELQTKQQFIKISNPYPGTASSFKSLINYNKFTFKTISNKILLIKLNKMNINRKNSIHKWLDKILADNRLSFDIMAAYAALENMTLQDYIEMKGTVNCTTELTEYKMMLGYQLSRCSSMKIAYIENDLCLSFVDKFGFRYHTPVTSLKKSFRKFFKWDGKPLYCLDISNSQPFFLCLSYVANHTELSDDWKEFIRLCSEGTLYESLNQLGISRNEFKKYFFSHLLFNTVKSMQSNNFALTFSSKFPKVYDYIIELKSNDNLKALKGALKDNAYKKCSQVLQRSESEAIQNVVAILKEKEIYPVITIHDCILTTFENCEKVAEAFIQVFSKYQLQPNIKVDEL